MLNKSIDNIIIRPALVEECLDLSLCIKNLVTNIPYYNEKAKYSEIAKYSNDLLIEKIKEDNLSVIIVLDGNKIIGFCLSRFDDYLIWLEWFGIQKEYRKLGLANKLLKYLETTIKARDCHKIWCDCRTDNQASIHILLNNGYLKIAEIKNHWYNQDFILWEKPLNIN